MKCPNCNTIDHEEGAVFCHICGTQLREVDVVSVKKDELNRLRIGNARLEELLQRGYAPNGKIIIDNAEYNRLKSRPPGEGGNRLKWFLAAALAIIVILLVVVTRNTINNVDSKQEVIVPETVIEHTDFPSNLSGNYIVRKLNGDNNSNASVKVYQEGRGYAMNVYSSNITRKYTFTYNPSTGEIASEELGSGRARIKGITNEIEITFAGWELLK